MKKIFAGLLALGALFLQGAQVLTPDIDGSFTRQKQCWNVLAPKNGTVRFLPGGIMKLKRNSSASYADAGNGKRRLKFLAGDQVELTFSARGKGQLAAGFRMDAGNVVKNFQLKEEFTEFSFKVDTGKVKFPQTGVIKFIIGKATPSVQIKNCCVKIIRTAPEETIVRTAPEAKISKLPDFTPPPLFQKGRFREVGFYLGQNLLVDKAIPKIAAIADRAVKAGYNTVYLCDWKFTQPWAFGERYVKRVREVASIFRTRNIRVVIPVAALGDPSPFMNECPEEVECLPSTGTVFKVVNGVFTPQNVIENGSFEEGLKRWKLDHKANIALDSKVRFSGKNSLRFEIKKPSDAPKGMIRAWYRIKVAPFQQYTLSFKMKTAGVKGPAGTFGIGAAPVGDDPAHSDGFRYLCYRKINWDNPIRSTQDWKSYKLTFNTLECKEIQLAFGGWGTQGGTFWIDDVQFKPASFLNVVRRSDTPVKVTLVKNGAVAREGKDYTPVIDPKCGNVRWKGDFNDIHEGPAVKVLPGSCIKEGDLVKADYYHAAFALTSVCICLNSPKLKPLIDKQIKWFQEVVRPEGFMIAIDEHRCYGYDPACVKSGIDGGTALRNMAVYTHGKIKKIAPKAAVYMWNDMFDPSANCRKGHYYYSIKGKGVLYGNWKGLPKDIIILRWTTGQKDKVKHSVKHWSSDMGMKYIHFPGYFTAPVFNPKSRSYMEVVLDDPNCVGVGFGQWAGLNNYTSHFENFTKMVKEMTK